MREHNDNLPQLKVKTGLWWYFALRNVPREIPDGYLSKSHVFTTTSVSLCILMFGNVEIQKFLKDHNI